MIAKSKNLKTCKRVTQDRARLEDALSEPTATWHCFFVFAVSRGGEACEGFNYFDLYTLRFCRVILGERDGFVNLKHTNYKVYILYEEISGVVHNSILVVAGLPGLQKGNLYKLVFNL